MIPFGLVMANQICGSGASLSVPLKLASAVVVNGAGPFDGALAPFEAALSVQLPPSAALPIRLVEASTSAPPAKVEKSLMNCWPAAPCATSQP